MLLKSYLIKVGHLVDVFKKIPALVFCNVIRPIVMFFRTVYLLFKMRKLLDVFTKLNIQLNVYLYQQICALSN